MKDALPRFEKWLGKARLRPPATVKLTESVAAACDERGHWLGAATYVVEFGDWTIFDDLSGHLGWLDPEEWRALASNDSLVVVGYNDAIICAELIVIEAGQVVRAFRHIDEQPEESLNIGKLPRESADPIKSWIEVASFHDDDDINPYEAENGLLLIHR